MTRRATANISTSKIAFFLELLYVVCFTLTGPTELL